MKRTLLLSSLLAFGMLFAATTASAGIVDMGYTGPQGNNSGGVYTYPYQFTFNGSGNYLLMCDSFNNSISPGDHWNATTLNVSSLNSTNVQGLEFPSAGVLGYLEVAYLFVEEASAFTGGNSDPKGLYNWAVWDLLTGQDVSGAHLSAGDETQVQTYLSDALAAGSGLSPAEFSNVVIYTPTDMSPSGPQEFFGYRTPEAPEPSTLALFGSGVLGLAGVLRRKLVN